MTESALLSTTTLNTTTHHPSTTLPPDKQLISKARSSTLLTSLAQERLWVLDQLEIEKAPFNTCGALRLQGTLNIDALRQALQSILQRHDSLRTTFTSNKGQAEQNIHPRLDMDLPLIIDLTPCPISERENRIQTLMTSEANTPFDLEFGPLFYAKLLRFSDDFSVLLFNGHQSVFDRSSLDILINETIVFYNAALAHQAAPLRDLSIQYKDYAQWQRQLLQDGTFDEQLKFWQNSLIDVPPILELPTDYPRPATQSLQTSAINFNFPASLQTQLQAFCDEHQTAVSTLLLTNFYILLFRYSGRSDLILGHLVPNRQIPTTAPMLGLFNNLLPLRATLSGTNTVHELLAQLKSSLQQALSRQELPFEKLIDTLSLERDLSRAPLVQITFNIDDHRQALPTMQGLSIETIIAENTLAGYDLSLSFELLPSSLRGTLLYATDLFNAATIQRMADHYLILLEGALNQPDQPIHALSLLTPAEYEQMVYTWNQTDTPFAQTLPVYRLVEEQAACRPNAVAAIYEKQQITYQALNQRANRLAHFLIDAGIGPDDIVALLAERNIDYLTAILAVHKAGAAFLPLDPRHPSARLAQILHQSESPFILTSPTYQNVVSEALSSLNTNPRMALIKDAIQDLRPDDNLPQRCSMSNLAYVMFTSGSTGTPKGVMVEHLGMLNHNLAKIADLQMTERDTLAQIGPQSFDIMVWQFVAPLIVGGKVHIFRDEIAYNPLALVEHIQAANISILQLVPAFLNTVVQEANATGRIPTFPDLRWIVPTGEALPTELCRQWLKLYPHIPLLNTYGSTECSDDQCHYPIHTAPPPDYPMPIMTIGTPIQNMSMYILDQWLQPVPIGAVGELYVGGIGVGRGYLKDPERTQKSFIANPFIKQDGACIYKTGDQGRYMSDGTIEFLGRVDHMVKVRGFRIELGEIESHLSQHPAIKHVVVIVREDTPNNKHIVAYYVPDAQQAPSLADLRNYVAAKLPDYMVPSAFVTMEALPLTANGKIDRKNLPIPDLAKLRADSFIAPRTPTEKFLAETWSDVLSLERVGIRDNFFELGGHSLLAIRIFSRIDKKYHQQLPLGTLFRAPTIEQLAKLLDEGADNLASTLIPIQEKGNLPPFFCVAGGVIHMRNLSHHLGEQQPLYALQMETLDDEQIANAELSKIAQQSVQEIRSVQPNGPYYLGGCFGGGTVALAMAQALAAEGEEVALMVAFNTLIKRRESSFIRRAFRRLRNVLHINPRIMYQRIRHDVDWENAREWFMEKIWKIAFKFYQLIGRPLPRFLRTGYFGEMLLRQAANTYKPAERYQKPVTLFVANEWYDSDSQDPTWGWSNLTTADVDVRIVPGDPCTIFTEPNVYLSAQVLKSCLENARSEEKAELNQS